jgi:hypothetical protein
MNSQQGWDLTACDTHGQGFIYSLVVFQALEHVSHMRAGMHPNLKHT